MWRFYAACGFTAALALMTWEEMMFPFFSVVVDKGVDPKKIFRSRNPTPGGA